MPQAFGCNQRASSRETGCKHLHEASLIPTLLSNGQSVEQIFARKEPERISRNGTTKTNALVTSS
jgi:hypothetical protein